MLRIGGVGVNNNWTDKKWQLTEGGMCGHAAMDTSHRSKFDDPRLNSCHYGQFVFVVITSERSVLSMSSVLH